MLRRQTRESWTGDRPRHELQLLDALGPQPLIKLERQLVRGKDRPDQLTSSSLPADDDSLAEKPFRQGEGTARGRFGARAGCSLPPAWLGVNISGGRPRMGLAVCFARPPSFGGPRTGMVPSCGCQRGQRSYRYSFSEGWADQTSECAYVSSQLCHPCAPAWGIYALSRLC